MDVLDSRSGSVKNDAPSSVIALRLTSANRTLQQHLVAAARSCSLKQRDDVLFLLDVAGGDVHRLVDDVLVA